MSNGGTLVAAGIVLIGAALIAPNLGRAPPPAPAAPSRQQSPAAVAPAPDADPGLAARSIRRAPDGHFYADAIVNGATIRFVVDTGASVVALTREDAQRAGLTFPAQRLRAIGAGGEMDVMPVTLDRVTLGPVEARDVPAVVGERLPMSLLGQSFLGRVGAVEIRGDTMTIR